MMRKFIITICFFGIYALVGAIEARPDTTTTIYPTIPGTSVRDFSKPGIKVERDGCGSENIYKTIPGTSVRDFNEPGYRVEDYGYGRREVYQTIPGTSVRDWREPGLIIEDY